MHRKWKSVTALGLAALLGCLMPANTMLAAEEDTEVVQETEADSVTDADEVSDDEAISDDNESVDEEENANGENFADEENAEDETVDDVVNEEDENVVDEVDADIDGNGGIAVMSETDGPEAGDVAVQSAAPVISIKWNGQDCIYDLGGKIDYKYVKDPDQKLEWSASQDGQKTEFYFYLDRNPGDTALGVDDITWSEKCLNAVEQALANNTTYVVYVKAEADGQTVYARSCGIVVDTEAPKVTGVADGGTYQEGTTFHVEDPNLESVTVNGKSMTLAADGNYQVMLDGALCEIKAKDKAGNETIYSISVTARELEADGVVAVNGTYALKPGVPYQLAEGKWKINGDSTVYEGGSTFYIMISDNYRFTKH